MANSLGTTLGTLGTNWEADGNHWELKGEHNENKLGTRHKWEKNPSSSSSSRSCSFLLFFVSAQTPQGERRRFCWVARLHASNSCTAAMQRGVGAVAGIAEGGGGNCAIMMQNYHHRHRRRRRLHHQQQQAPLFSASLYAPSLSLLSPSIPRRQLTTLLSGTSTSSSFKFFDNSSCRLQFGGMFS